MGLPAGAVKNALQRDGKDPSIIDLDPEKSLKSQSGGAVEEKDDGPPLCEDPQFTKVSAKEVLPRHCVAQEALLNIGEPSHWRS
jgi:hypothetical protein